MHEVIICEKPSSAKKIAKALSPSAKKKVYNKKVKYWELKRDDYKPVKKAKFEDHEFNIPNNDDNTLIPIYGDYMQLPPEEEQFCHILNEIDFGEY